jgi:hypothetical protein
MGTKDERLAILRSREAQDITWFYRFSDGRVGGLQACDPRRADPETVDVPHDPPDRTMKLCRVCTLALGAEEPECPFCHGRRFVWPKARPDGVMHVKPSRRGAARSTTEIADHRLVLVPKERRIRGGLAKLTAEGRATIEQWALSRQHGPEVWRELGQAGDLAMHREPCRKAFAAYTKAGGEHSLEVWLINMCCHADHHRAFITKIRRDAEDAAIEQIVTFKAVVEAPSPFELRGEERPCVGVLPRAGTPPRPKIKHKSALERVRSILTGEST